MSRKRDRHQEIPRDLMPRLTRRRKNPHLFPQEFLTWHHWERIGLTAVFFGILGAYAPAPFDVQLLYFILAGFLGYYLIWAVEPALFSPLKSASNSLSGVVILGGILMASTPIGSPTNVLGCIAIAVSAINFFGGFAVSYRMLLMFKKERTRKANQIASFTASGTAEVPPELEHKS